MEQKYNRIEKKEVDINIYYLTVSNRSLRVCTYHKIDDVQVLARSKHPLPVSVEHRHALHCCTLIYSCEMSMMYGAIVDTSFVVKLEIGESVQPGISFYRYGRMAGQC